MDAGSEQANALNFRQLKLFKAIGDLQSVRRASEECGLSQPAVTQALAKLEDLVGVKLVDRRASGSYLNHLGAVLYARVDRFFGQTEQAVIDLGVAATTAGAQRVVNRLTRSQIRAMIATSERGSFETAADMLGISVASLQRAARDLEGNVRTPLFHRTAMGTIVGPAGARFARQMKLALQEVELGLDEVAAARGAAGRQMIIGAMPFGGSVLLASALNDFLNLYPQADIRIASDSAAHMAASLRAGEVDLVVGLLADTPSPDLIAEPVAQTPYSVVVRRGHPLAAKAEVTIDDLVTCDWVIGTEGSSRRHCFERIFAGRRGPTVQIATCATPVIRQLLESSNRVTLMTSYELQYADGRLHPLSFQPAGDPPSIGITMRANWMPTRLHADFIDLIRRHAAALTDRPRLRAVS